MRKYNWKGARTLPGVTHRGRAGPHFLSPSLGDYTLTPWRWGEGSIYEGLVPSQVMVPSHSTPEGSTQQWWLQEQDP